MVRAFFYFGVIWSTALPAATATLDGSCGERVTLSADIETGVALALEQEKPLSTAFGEWVRNPDPAIAFAESSDSHTLSFKSRGATWVKYSPKTGDLVITVRNRVVFYTNLELRRFEFERPKDVFHALYRAQVRGGQGMVEVRPFHPLSLVRHCREHCREFQLLTDAEYEQRALDFARRSGEDMLTIDFVENGQPRSFKTDFGTGEVVVTGKDGTLLTYYLNNGSGDPYRKFFTNLRKALNF